jgi:hypothetical protein
MGNEGGRVNSGGREMNPSPCRSPSRPLS